MAGGKGRLPGQDLKRDLAMHVYLIFITFRLYGKNVCRDVFRPVRVSVRSTAPSRLPGRYYPDFANYPR